ncbi:Macro domain-containing protein [Entamoeba marina]
MFPWRSSKHNNNNFPALKPKFIEIKDISLWSGDVDYMFSTHYEVNPVLNDRVAIYQGDITKLKFDAVVNAANSGLRGGGGVDGCIHRAAGNQLIQYLVKHYNHCPTGDFKPTPGFNMPCKHILHGVGPIGEHPKELKSVYIRCMNYMKENKLKTIAFPCISTGIYGYDNENACPVVLSSIRKWLENNLDWKGVIVFCCYSDKDTQIYKNNIATYFPKHTQDEIQQKCVDLNNELAKLTKEKEEILKNVITKENLGELNKIRNSLNALNKQENFYYKSIEDSLSAHVVVEPVEFEKNVEPKKPKKEVVDKKPKDVEPKATEPKEKGETNAAETKKDVEPKTAEPKDDKTKAVEIKDVEPKEKNEPKTAEPKDAEPKDAEPKEKDEPKTAEPKDAEPKDDKTKAVEIKDGETKSTDKTTDSEPNTQASKQLCAPDSKIE